MMVILINDETTASHELDEQLAKFLGVTVAPFSHMTDAALSAVPEGWTPTFDGKAWTLSYTSVNGEGNTTTYAFGGYPATSSALSSPPVEPAVSPPSPKPTGCVSVTV